MTAIYRIRARANKRFAALASDVMTGRKYLRFLMRKASSAIGFDSLLRVSHSTKPAAKIVSLLRQGSHFRAESVRKGRMQNA
jgi:hypothetical protein